MAALWCNGLAALATMGRAGVTSAVAESAVASAIGGDAVCGARADGGNGGGGGGGGATIATASVVVDGVGGAHNGCGVDAGSGGVRFGADAGGSIGSDACLAAVTAAATRGNLLAVAGQLQPL